MCICNLLLYVPVDSVRVSLVSCDGFLDQDQ